MEDYKKQVLDRLEITSKCLEFIASIDFIGLNKIFPSSISFDDPVRLISDSELFNIIREIDSENDRNFILGMINKKEVKKRVACLKGSDANSFFENINIDKLKLVKILVGFREMLKQKAIIFKELIHEIDSKEENYLSQFNNILDEINQKYPVDWMYDVNKEIKQFYVENNRELDLAANDEEKLNLFINLSFETLMASFYIVDTCVPPDKAKPFWNILSESEYAPDFQELHNQYRSEYLYANDNVICEYKFKKIEKSLPIGFDANKYDPFDRRCLHTKLNKAQIEYLYRELMSRGYISEDTGIKCFAFFLTGKPKKYDEFEKMKWMGQQLELGCFIGLLYKGQGRWVATENAFTSEKGLDTKGLASSLGKIEGKIKAAKEKNEEYNHESYEYFKKLIEDMKNIS